MTNSLEVLQARYQEDETNIQQALVKLDQVRKTYKATDQPFLDEQHKVEQMIEFHKLLAAKIEADKLEAQFPAQGKH